MTKVICFRYNANIFKMILLFWMCHYLIGLGY